MDPPPAEGSNMICNVNTLYDLPNIIMNGYLVIRTCNGFLFLVEYTLLN